MLACGNLDPHDRLRQPVNLLLARGASRERESRCVSRSAQVALESSGNFALESALIGILGGALGLLVSLWSCDFISASIAGTASKSLGGALRLSLNLTPDWRIFAYTAALSLLTGIDVGYGCIQAAKNRPQPHSNRNHGNRTGHAAAVGAAATCCSRTVAACLTCWPAPVCFSEASGICGQPTPVSDTKHAFYWFNPREIAAAPASRTRCFARSLTDCRHAGSRFPCLGGSTRLYRARLGRCERSGTGSNAFLRSLPLLRNTRFGSWPGETSLRAKIESAEPVVNRQRSAAQRVVAGQRSDWQASLGADGWMRRKSGTNSFTVVGVVRVFAHISLQVDHAFYIPQISTKQSRPDAGAHGAAAGGGLSVGLAALSGVQSNRRHNLS